MDRYIARIVGEVKGGLGIVTKMGRWNSRQRYHLRQAGWGIQAINADEKSLLYSGEKPRRRPRAWRPRLFIDRRALIGQILFPVAPR